MSFVIALCLLGLWLILEPIIDRKIKARKKRLEKERREEIRALHERCDQLDADAEKLAQEILQSMKDVERMPENQRQYFYDKYSELMFTVDSIHAHTSITRKQFPLEEELANV